MNIDEAPDTADDSDEDLITSYIPGISNKPGHPIIRIGSPTAGNNVLSDDRPILGMGNNKNFNRLYRTKQFYDIK